MQRRTSQYLSAKVAQSECLLNRNSGIKARALCGVDRKDTEGENTHDRPIQARGMNQKPCVVTKHTLSRAVQAAVEIDCLELSLEKTTYKTCQPRILTLLQARTFWMQVSKQPVSHGKARGTSSLQTSVFDF